MLPNKPSYMQQRGMEFHAWIALCLAMGVERYLEIGTHEGGSANFVIRSGIPWVVAVDIMPEQPAKLDSRITFVSGNGHVPQTREKVLEMFGGLYPQAVFIDGDHEGDNPRLDFEMWWPLTTTLLGFHDFLEMPAVKCVWEEQSKKYKSLEIVSRETFSQRDVIPGSHNWGGIGVLFR